MYVIAWARGQLRINFTCIFKVFTKLPESRCGAEMLKVKPGVVKLAFAFLSKIFVQVRTKEEKCFDMFSKNVLERLFRSVSFSSNEKDNFSL